MQQLHVLYSTFGNIYGQTQVYYITQNNGTYTLYAVTDAFSVTCNVTASADITDFTTNHQSAAISVNTPDDAMLLGWLANSKTLVAPRNTNGSSAIGGNAAAGSSPTGNPILVGSWDGTNVRTFRSDTFGNPIITPLPYAISAGLISGVTANRVQGYTTTSATSGKVIRATTYTPQGTNAQRSINSTSASDTSAGTGARTVTINYLDTSFVSHSETVTLNGTTAVATVGTNIAFIESIAVASVGSGGGNVGTIQVWTANNGTGSVWGSIAASDNQTFWAHHYVPSGATCYLLAFTCGATVVAGQTNLNHSGNPLSTNVPQLQIGPTLMHAAAAPWDHDFEVPLAVTGPDLIWLVERPTATTASTALGGFEYIQF